MDSRNCSLTSKLIRWSLASTGVVLTHKRIWVFLSVVSFHLIRFLHIAEVVSSLLDGDPRTGFLKSICAEQVINFLLWWNLFFKKAELLRFVESLVNKININQRKKLTAIVIGSLTFYPFGFTILYMIWFDEKIYDLSQVPPYKRYWIPTDFRFVSEAIFVIDSVVMHSTFAIFFITMILYCVISALILKLFDESHNEISRVDASTEWKKCRTVFHAITDLESKMSFQIFLVFCRIAIQGFIFVLKWNQKSSIRDYPFLIANIETLVAFFFIVYLADMIQNHFSKNLDKLYCQKQRLKLLGITNFHYNRMIRGSKLTAWKICLINRNLVFTFAASLLTYSVLIVGEIYRS
ncbi:hypothetical protein AVEN_38258-1 [Araneus ventricosus]|uniref:Uncharacterized protein n=1 Tax=Araneus ventricosus TaxID=182803 RepID=A0A4Y2TNE6_ARAVE|nr:hypothetical protein AVEN_38258-1 [Araneus ventricosus]